MKTRIFSAIIALLVSTAISNRSLAGVIMFAMPPGSTTGGNPVSAQATFTTSSNQVVVVIKNLEADPVSVVQAISGLQFKISSGQNSGTIISSSGVERTIDDSGVYADGAAADTGWELATVGTSLKLDLLGAAMSPKHTIIGPPDGGNLYSSANSSVTGSSHNPLLGLSATFTLNVPGVTSSSSITAARFQFNTGAGNEVLGTLLLPEPAMTGLLGLLSTALVSRSRRTR